MQVNMVQTCFKSWPSADPMRRIKRSTMLWLITRKNSSSTAENYRKAISWSLDINTAFFFACRHGDQNHARIIRAKIRRKDVFALNLDSREKEVLAIPGTPYDVTTERLIGPDSPLVMPFRYLDEYRKGVEQILRLYKLHQRGGTDHGKLHTARVLFLALTIIQAGKIRLNRAELSQLTNAIVFHDIGRKNDRVDDGHGKAGREVYEKNAGSSADPAVCFLIEYHCLDDKLAEEYLKTGQETHLVPVSDFKRRGCPGSGEVRDL